MYDHLISWGNILIICHITYNSELKYLLWNELLVIFKLFSLVCGDSSITRLIMWIMSGQKVNNMTKIIKGTHITIYISRASSKKEATGNQNCIKQLYAYTSLYNRYCDTPAWEFDSWLSEVIYNWTMHMFVPVILTLNFVYCLI